MLDKILKYCALFYHAMLYDIIPVQICFTLDYQYFPVLMPVSLPPHRTHSLLDQSSFCKKFNLGPGKYYVITFKEVGCFVSLDATEYLNIGLREGLKRINYFGAIFIRGGGCIPPTAPSVKMIDFSKKEKVFQRCIPPSGLAHSPYISS